LVADYIRNLDIVESIDKVTIHGKDPQKLVKGVRWNHLYGIPVKISNCSYMETRFSLAKNTQESKMAKKHKNY
jgi:hypothetical protein